MQIDYQKTFADLKEKELIQNNDKYAVCLFQPESEDNGVTRTVITAKTDFVMSVNDEELKLFEIDKKTGEYLDDFLLFKKSDLAYGKKLKERKTIWASKGLFGGMYVAIQFVAEKFVHMYKIPKKIHRFDQTEAGSQLYMFVKEVYNAAYNEKKQEYKNSKR